MTFDIENDEEILDILISAGWHPDREINIELFSKYMLKLGWIPFPVCIDFMESFGDMIFKPVNPDSTFTIYTLPFSEIFKRLPFNWSFNEELSEMLIHPVALLKIVGSRYYPIGFSYDDYIYIDEQGRLFKSSDGDSIYYLGKDVLSGLKFLLF